ncbi:uncharacterized protein ARMOST_00035 [Armillaria ostoyae]|uniref:Uncharacterized protein n=1 Tax=Armillaria ostoyae TaxID=47428 RepID=A0A284QK10_ARMOS|nr:uncharacterized protein ARMOST_00035 [Armillaria ostoyae]
MVANAVSHYPLFDARSVLLSTLELRISLTYTKESTLRATQRLFRRNWVMEVNAYHVPASEPDELSPFAPSESSSQETRTCIDSLYCARIVTFDGLLVVEVWASDLQMSC